MRCALALKGTPDRIKKLVTKVISSKAKLKFSFGDLTLKLDIVILTQTKNSLIIKVRARKKLGGHPPLQVKIGDELLFKILPNQWWFDMGIPSNADGFNNVFLGADKTRIKNVKCFKLCETINDNKLYNFEIGLGQQYKVNANGF